jgi:hypothetical protein
MAINVQNWPVLLEKDYVELKAAVMDRHNRMFVSTPRQAGKSWIREMLEQSKPSKGDPANPERLYEYPRWCMVIDPAKPGNDRTAVVGARQFGDKIEITELLTDEGKAALERIEAKPMIDHTWDMLVLAARSSRYGNETP